MSDSLVSLVRQRRDAEAEVVGQPLASREALMRVLETWVRRGWLRKLDKAFAGFLLDLQPDSPPLVLLAAALASHQLGQGHACLDLEVTLAEPDFALSLPPEGDLARDTWLPSRLLAAVGLAQWLDVLASSPLVDLPPGERQQPLLLSGHALYLRRYWNHEQTVAGILRQRLASPLVPAANLAQRLEQLFPPTDAAVIDWQKLACALAVRGRFTLITGGPGTGKTTTVVRLLALLQLSAMEQGQPLRICLAAPTGKAAARLTESIGRQVASLPVDDAIREAIPSSVQTLHRLLGSRPGSRRFRHHAGNPLSLDVLVIDEGSMIDLEMMASVLAALPPQSRLVLLGDKDQLASVEAGAVLGDLCRDAESGYYSPGTLAWLQQVCGQAVSADYLLPGNDQQHPLAQQTVMLRQSRRFEGGGGIGRLAEYVNRQQVDQALALLASRADDLAWLQGGERLDRLFIDGGYRPYLDYMRERVPPDEHDEEGWQTWALGVLQAFDGFRVLCALRKGDWGIEGLNLRIEAQLQRHGLIDAQREWYEGRPLLVTRNDYALGLMNGDIGIVLRVPSGVPGETVLRVAFPRNDGSGRVRLVLPSRLGQVETVYAMTVHKSQGSEFTHTALVLPETLGPVLTKELVYTAITRARERFTLVEPGRSVFERAVARRVRRLSGLRLHL